MSASPFLIGIDLGTTNTAVALVDTRAPAPRVEPFRIAQLTAPGHVERRLVLPSFLYFPEPGEVGRGALALPWDPEPHAIVGALARDAGAVVPGRQVASAKSWLAHPGVNHQAAFLPWGSSDSSPRVSPVDASTRYLAHLRDAWNADIARGDDALRFERQSIVLTVPASFDEEARELTVVAARAAGLSQLTLLEEPIAAFYTWMAEHQGVAPASADEVALVCDVGGGTTDFSLVRVRTDDAGPVFERMAIGDHLLLGGDNLDLALATLLERRLEKSHPGTRLSITQRSALRRRSGDAKEVLLADDGPARVSITVLGGGRSLVGGSLTVDLTREDVDEQLREFLPLTDAGDVARGRDRRAGLRELGLPYESDPAITRHLAGFLTRSAAVFPPGHRAIVTMERGAMVRPDLILFNGGFFTPAVARTRVVDVLTRWFGVAPRVLSAGNLEAAVATGAATYARLRAGIGGAGPLVKAGSGRAYYIALHAADSGADAVSAVCVLARGTEEGTHQTLAHAFTVTTNRPIAFALFSATARSDRVGEIVALHPDDDAHEHAALVTVLRFGRKSRHVELPVRLSVAYTEVGTLEVWCGSVSTDHRWRLQFQVRQSVPVADAAAPSPDTAAGAQEMSSAADLPGAADAVRPGDDTDATQALIADEALASATAVIRGLFTEAPADPAADPTAATHASREVIASGEGTPSGDVTSSRGGIPSGEVTPENIVAQLEALLGYAKSAWPIGAIRVLADVLLEVADGRRRTAALEARWLNLFGFCLRPGFGAAKDPWRIGEARKVYTGGLLFASSIQNRVEWLVLWQRAAGGLSTGQQRELAQRVMGELGLGVQKVKKPNPQVERESWRLLASLERLDPAVRVKIGDEVVRRLRRTPGDISLAWSIGRLGARVPAYGPLTSVVPAADAQRWLETLLTLRRDTPELASAIVQIGALTGDALRDIDAAARDAARRRLVEAAVDPLAIRPLHEVVAASATDTSRAFGEPLPHGLRLVAGG